MHFPWGTLLATTSTNSGRADALPASYDWQGNRFVWQSTVPGAQVTALDVERLDTAPSELAGQKGLSWPDFLLGWTRLEALAKLLDQPILHLYRCQPFIVPVVAQPYDAGLNSHPDARFYTGFWTEKNLVFTCGILTR